MRRKDGSTLTITLVTIGVIALIATTIILVCYLRNKDDSVSSINDLYTQTSNRVTI